MAQEGSERPVSRVMGLRRITESTFIVSVERGDKRFVAGQHLALGLPSSHESREYSIYSGEGDSPIEFLIKEVDGGLLSNEFAKLRAGDSICMYNAWGAFTIPEPGLRGRKFVFVASGTGIAPFHSFVRTYPGLDYQLLLGVRLGCEACDRDHYEASRFVLCTSRDKQGDCHGRVTDYLRDRPADLDALYYLCGNYQMIKDVYSILEAKGVSKENVRTEVYFYF
jgi:ferredoxin/flavodoxin---NADP+ reductase